MGQVLHGSATTTETVRRAIQNSQASIRTLAQQYHINPKTVAKWKKRQTVHDAAMGSKQKCSSVLSQAEESLIVSFRKLSLLPLDDCTAKPYVPLSQTSKAGGLPKMLLAPCRPLWEKGLGIEGYLSS